MRDGSVLRVWRITRGKERNRTMAVRASIYVAASHVEARITPHSTLGRNVSRQYNEKPREAERWTTSSQKKEIRKLIWRDEDSDDAVSRHRNVCVCICVGMIVTLDSGDSRRSGHNTSPKQKAR